MITQPFMIMDGSMLNEVYSLIKDDLKTAIANLPNYYSANNMQGRATKIAAYTMQADVFMTLQDFNSAKNSLENISGLCQSK